MDDDNSWAIYFSLAAGVVMALIGLHFLKKYQDNQKKENGGGNEQQRAAAGRPRPGGVPAGGGNRRAGIAGRNRRIAAARRVDDSDSDGGGPPARVQPDDSDEDKEINLPGGSKLGTKKAAKLEAKEEKKQQREVETRLREEKKAKDAKEDEERKKREEEEEEEERRQAQEAKRLIEEQKRREEEAYLAMKGTFTVEGEGCDVHESDEEDNLLEKFVDHIKEKKVILFEELATHFNLKVPAAIDRLNTLVTEGRLTGVMDDRGKFIYISEEELSKFAKFIKQRGRVSISDLVDNSSSIINLVQEPKSTPAVEV